MPNLSRDAFSIACADDGVSYGVSPHYLMAAAQLRTSIVDISQGNLHGPFKLTQELFDANSTASEFELAMQPADFALWRFHVAAAAIMALRAQRRFIERTGAFPSVLDLYQEQWAPEPMPAALANDLNDALKATAAEITAAVQSEFDIDHLDDDTAVFTADQPPPLPLGKPTAPLPTQGATLFQIKAPWVMQQLMDDFGLTDQQAAGILGNIGHECSGFRLMQEVKPRAGRGGLGWCQWTETRRVAFETFCTAQGVTTSSDVGNYGYLKQELSTRPFNAAISGLRGADLSHAVRSFEGTFENAASDAKFFDRRDVWAQRALDAYRRTLQTLPAKVGALLDADASSVAVKAVHTGATSYFLVDEAGEGGGQVLVQWIAGQPPAVIKRDSMLLPLPPNVVPPEVATIFAQGMASQAPPAPPRPPAGQPVGNVKDIAQKVLAEAKRSDGTLRTAGVPDTNHGRRACAWAVNHVVEGAIGRQAGGGLSTSAMADALRQHAQSLTQDTLIGGCIIISPTQGKRIGHVGILGDLKADKNQMVIYSNSSNMGLFFHIYTLARWKAYYHGRLGLDVLFYALTP